MDANTLTTVASLEEIWLPFVLALARVSAFLLAAPLLGHGTVPNLVKMGLCLGLSAFFVPRYAADLASQSGAQPALAIQLVMEFVVGVALGYIMRLVMLPTRIAGSYIGQELGFNLGQVADPTTGSNTNEAGMLFDAFALVVLWATNTHHTAFRMLGVSIGSLQGDRSFIDAFTMAAAKLLSYAHELGIMMVAPLASILFLILLYLGVAMRAWPQVTLFSFGMGARLLLGLAAFFLLMPLLISNMADVIQGMARMMYDWVAS